MRRKTSVARLPPSDRWALASIWLVFAATLVFSAWSYAVDGWSAAAFWLAGQVLGWALEFITLAAFFAALLLILHAWPGRRPYWRSVLVTAVLGTVPSSVVTADFDAHSFASIACCTAPTFWNCLILHSRPELVVFDLLTLALSVWVALLYFPAVRGWRFGMYLVLSAIVLLALPVSFPLHTP
ncbi:MAG: hypothetical protein M0Z66_04790 [Thermaerobacter sp.]|nr:hypothetical protein [Thermaerobacter sp.]